MTGLPFEKNLPKAPAARVPDPIVLLVTTSRVCHPIGPQPSWKLSPGPIGLDGGRERSAGQARIAIAATLRNSVSVAPLATWTASPFRTVAT